MVYLIICIAYFLAGILFYPFFLAKGIHHVDATAHAATWGFKVLILPGVLLLWPVLLFHWVTRKS